MRPPAEAGFEDVEGRHPDAQRDLAPRLRQLLGNGPAEALQDEGVEDKACGLQGCVGRLRCACWSMVLFRALQQHIILHVSI